MNLLIFLFQQSNIVDEKLKNAPDSGYAIGVVIGYLLPFTVIAALAYILYSYFKNKRDS